VSVERRQSIEFRNFDGGRCNASRLLYPRLRIDGGDGEVYSAVRARHPAFVCRPELIRRGILALGVSTVPISIQLSLRSKTFSPRRRYTITDFRVRQQIVHSTGTLILLLTAARPEIMVDRIRTPAVGKGISVE